MVRKDPEERVHLKIVFYGASMSGKTTQLRSVYSQTETAENGQMVVEAW